MPDPHLRDVRSDSFRLALHHGAVMNAVRDTRTLGQRRSDGRRFGPAQTPHRRRNRDFRPVLRVNVLPALVLVTFCTASALFARFWFSPTGQAFFHALRSQP